MAVLREGNWLGNQRVDIPHLRAVESSVRGDFDLLAGAMLAGKSPEIISGFYVISTGITIAANLKIRVADSSLIHFLASESGSIFHVPADRDDEQITATNPRVIGGFTPSQVNYVGIDFVRQADDTTVDLVEFIDSDSELETPVQVPLARTTDYRIIISTLDFDNNPGIAPICKVTTDGGGNIVLLEDARNIAFRLGTGGTIPDRQHAFPWPAGRKENTTGDVFVGGDKTLNSFKSWMDSVMSRLWEVGGGEYWYSPTTYANERLARTGSPFSNGEFFEWDGSNLHWKGLVWIFANSTGVTNVVTNVTVDTPGLTDLLDGECVYVDVDRTQDTTIVAVKGELSTLGSPEVPGSRYVLAWRYGAEVYTRDQSYAINSAFQIATFASQGTVKLSASGLDNTADPIATAMDDAGWAYAQGLTRGGGGAGGTANALGGGAGTLKIGFGQYDTDIEMRPGDAGGGTIIRSINDDMLLQASHGDLYIQAFGNTAGEGTLTLDATAGDATINRLYQFDIEELSGHNQSAANNFVPAGSVCSISGATSVFYIDTAVFGHNGTKLYLQLANGVTIAHNTVAPPAGFAPILLSGSNTVTTADANQVLALIYIAATGFWHEFSKIA